MSSFRTASCPHFPAVHVAHIQGCGDVQHEALEAKTEKEEHHGEDDVPQLTAGDMAWFSPFPFVETVETTLFPIKYRGFL